MHQASKHHDIPDRVQESAAGSLAVADIRMAYTLLRGAFGVNILMHGAARLGSLSEFVDGVTAGFAATIVPSSAVRAVAWAIAPLELAIGLLILVGFYTRNALLSGAMLMVVLTIGVTLQQRWEVAGLQLTYILVYALLLAGLAFNQQSLDGWRAKGRAS